MNDYIKYQRFGSKQQYYVTLAQLLSVYSVKSHYNDPIGIQGLRETNQVD